MGRKKLMGILIIVLAILNFADYGITVWLLSLEGGAEGNRFMDALLHVPGAFGLVKLGLVPAGLWLIWANRYRVRRSLFVCSVVGIAVAAYTGLMVWNGYNICVLHQIGWRYVQ